MYRYFSGYASTYTASYYRSRLSYYGALTIMVGAVQLALGKYMLWSMFMVPVAVGCSEYYYCVYDALGRRPRSELVINVM